MKVSLLLLAAFALCAALRRRSAALRHWVLAAAVLGCIAIPVVERIVPSWRVDVSATAVLGALRGARAPAPSRPAVAAASAPDALGEDATRRPTDSAARAPSDRWTAAAMFAWAWLAGTAASLLVLLVGFTRLAWVTARAHRIDSGAWATLAAEIAREVGLSRPITLLCGSHPGVLVTWGFARPTILVPPAALTWDTTRIRVVLHHELAHVVRGDWLTQLAAEILRAAYWFNPLTWMACRRLRDESEQAADDAVLRCGVDAADYAAQLLDLARAITHHRRTWTPAPAIARPSSLERRVTAMLNGHLDRQPISRAARLGVGALVVTLTAVVSSLVFAQGGPARFSGSVSDPSGAPLPNTTISLTHRALGVTHAAPTDETGTFAFAALPAGEYALEARAMGFATVKDTMTLAAGDSVQRDFRLNIGSIEETVTISAAPLTEPRPARPPADVTRILERFRGQRLQPPVKLNHVAPTYPPALRDAGVEGQVVLAARVAADGSVTGIDVVTSAHPDLVTSATDAARQWRFEPTRLWGTPVEVGITITFNFRAQR